MVPHTAATKCKVQAIAATGSVHMLMHYQLGLFSSQLRIEKMVKETLDRFFKGEQPPEDLTIVSGGRLAGSYN